MAGLLLSPANADADQRDSDAAYSGNNAVISVTTGAAGNNDHTFDFGFTGSYSLGNRVWFDNNNNATLDGAEVSISGVRVELYQDNGASPGVWDAGDTSLGFDTTDLSGYYRFDGLVAGEYVVLLPDDNFRNVGAGDTVASDPLSGYWSSSTSIAANGTITDATVNDPDTTSVDSDDNGRTTLIANEIDYVASAAVTLGPGTSEPTTDSDPVTNPEAGEAANNRSDRTVDFGFYKVDIGNLVFEDVNGDGDYDAGTDVLLAGATVQLFASDGVTEINVGVDGILGTPDDLLGNFVTGPLGTYNFSGLPKGDYIIHATPPAGYTSTVDTAVPADTTDPDTNTDNNDNGIGLGSGAVDGGILTMSAGEIAAHITVNNATGSTTDPSVDFGFLTTHSLANRIWFDTDNDSTRDVAEVGVNGVVVQLYAADAAGNPTGVVLQTTTTAGGGYYRFDGLVAGDYVVVITADNFTNDGSDDALVGYWSSATTMNGTGIMSETPADDPDDNDDFDDNGTLQTAGAFSGAVIGSAVTIGPGASEPVGETDLSGGQGSADDHANMTVDFGFYRLQLGNLVFKDVDNDGVFTSGTDTLLAGAVVTLYAADGATQILVGADGVLGTADDGVTGVTTGAGGTYLVVYHKAITSFT